MRLTSLRLRLLAGLAVVLAPVAAACAGDESDPGEERSPDSSLPHLDGGAGGSGDAACDAADGCPPTDCKTADFCPVSSPVSSLVVLNAISGSSPTDLWAVGSRGTILHGNGTTFTPVASGTEAYFYAVRAAAPDDVWIAAAGAPLHSSPLPDGGTGWEPIRGEIWQDGPESDRIWALWGSSKEVWLAGQASWRFGNLASFWSKGEGGDGGVVWSGVEAYAFGVSWYPNIRGLWGLGPNDIWAVGEGGMAFHYAAATDAAPAHFSGLYTTTRVNLEGVWGSSASDVWAVGQGGTIRRWTNDASRTFAAVASPTTKGLHAIWGSGPNDVWAVGDGATVVHYDGKEWTLASAGLAPGFAPDLFGIWGSGPDDVWIVGESVILHRTTANRRTP